MIAAPLIWTIALGAGLPPPSVEALRVEQASFGYTIVSFSEVTSEHSRVTPISAPLIHVTLSAKVASLAPPPIAFTPAPQPIQTAPPVSLAAKCRTPDSIVPTAHGEPHASGALATPWRPPQV
ncbi:MAG TPA: hypothetical protein VFF06_26055 [Polyangia bacterium]|nr:hypothetical protein [Polyangia bacterium]